MGLKDLFRLCLWFTVLNISFCDNIKVEEKCENCEPSFKLTVIILTMNRPHSLARYLLKTKLSLNEYSPCMTKGTRSHAY